MSLTQLNAPKFDFKDYRSLSNEQLSLRINAVKEKFGDAVQILGHHYQQDEVIEHCDLRGDSLQLSQLAAQRDCEAIVFCGVHFMAETADILTDENQKVILPDMRAGCSMADMARIEPTKRHTGPGVC